MVFHWVLDDYSLSPVLQSVHAETYQMRALWVLVVGLGWCTLNQLQASDLKGGSPKGAAADGLLILMGTDKHQAWRSSSLHQDEQTERTSWWKPRAYFECSRKEILAPHLMGKWWFFHRLWVSERGKNVHIPWPQKTDLSQEEADGPARRELELPRSGRAMWCVSVEVEYRVSWCLIMGWGRTCWDQRLEWPGWLLPASLSSVELRRARAAGPSPGGLWECPAAGQPTEGLWH